MDNKTMSDLFKTWPSEAVITGRVFNRFRSAAAPPSNCPARFVPYFFESLRSYFGVPPRAATDTLPHGKSPADIQGGWSKTEPNCYFEALATDAEIEDLKRLVDSEFHADGNSSGTTPSESNDLSQPRAFRRIRFDLRHRFLEDLLFDLVSPHSQVTTDDLCRYRPRSVVQAWEGLDEFQFPMPFGAFDANGGDDLTRVADALDELFRFSDLEEYYRVGKMFGSLTFASDALQQYLTRCEQEEAAEEKERIDRKCIESRDWLWQLAPEYDESTFVTVTNTIIDALVASPVLSRSGLEVAIEKLTQVGEAAWYLESYDTQTCIRCLAEFRADIECAFGMVLGALRTVDEEARQKDAQSGIPRELLVISTEPSDRELALIADLHYDVRERRRSRDPTTIIAKYHAMIESACKSVWPTWKSECGPKGSISDVIARRLTADGVEKQFAILAMFLLKYYSNPTKHELLGTKLSDRDLIAYAHLVPKLKELAEDLISRRPILPSSLSK